MFGLNFPLFLCVWVCGRRCPAWVLSGPVWPISLLVHIQICRELFNIPALLSKATMPFSLTSWLGLYFLHLYIFWISNFSINFGYVFLGIKFFVIKLWKTSQMNYLLRQKVFRQLLLTLALSFWTARQAITAKYSVQKH